MSHTYRNKPAKEREIEILKKERGNKRRMTPYKRSKQQDWED